VGRDGTEIHGTTRTTMLGCRVGVVIGEIR
jgi:hypothetical protein